MQNDLQLYLKNLGVSNKKKKSESTQDSQDNTPKKYTVDVMKESYNNWLVKNVPANFHTLFHLKRLQIHLRSNLSKGEFLNALKALQYTPEEFEVDGVVIPDAGVTVKFWGVGNNTLNLS